MERELNKNKVRDLVVKIIKLEYHNSYTEIINNFMIPLAIIGAILLLLSIFGITTSIFIAEVIIFLLLGILSKIQDVSEKLNKNDYYKIKRKYSDYFRLNNEFEKAYNKFLFYVNKDLKNDEINVEAICEIYKNINTCMKLLQKQVNKLIEIKNLEEKNVFLKNNEYNKIKEEFLHEAQLELKYFIADFYEKLKIWLDTHKKKLQELNKKLLNEKEVYDKYAKKAVYEISSFAILEQVNYLEKIKI